MFDLDHYLSLVPSFNATKPKFTATLAAILQPFADAQVFLDDLPSQFDLDTAIGAQLDVVGQWIGQSRYIPVPLQNLWFSFNDSARGFGKGIWKGPYDAGTGITRLDDETYRRLLRAIAAANEWDGLLSSALTALGDFFDQSGSLVFIQDNGDMSAVFGVSQMIPSVLDLLLLSRGYIPLKPQSVKTTYRVTSVNNTPLFGFGVQNEYVAGFGYGAWGVSPEYIALNAV